MTPEERFAAAKELLDQGDYIPAKTQFQILILNHPGTDIADDSQYFLAEAHFGLKEYILAAAEYQKLIRNYPHSELVDDAQYKVGMSYYELSPGYALDQKYTMMAIVEFQRFLEDFPGSTLRQEVFEKLTEARNKLAKKDLKNGNLYRRQGFYQAAIIYFDELLANYYDTEHAEEALFRKGQCLYKMKDWAESQKILEDFVQKYPKSHFVPLAQEQIDTAIQKHSSNGQK